MSVRVEWTSTDWAHAEWLRAGEEAPDGQTHDVEGEGVLVIGDSLAITGTPEAMRVVLERALEVIPRA